MKFWTKHERQECSQTLGMTGSGNFSKHWISLFYLCFSSQWRPHCPSLQARFIPYGGISLLQLLAIHSLLSSKNSDQLTFTASVQLSCSVVSDSVLPWTKARQASPSITNSQNLLKLMSIESVMPSNHLILCCHLLLLPSVFPSIRVFSNEFKALV